VASASPSATEPGSGPPSEAGAAAPSDARPGLEPYAAALYARPGVAEACLELQDRLGADVNLLLAACWLAARGVRLDAAAAGRLRGLAAAWREPVVAPLRRARRALRPLAAGPLGAAAGERAQRLRAQVAAAELEAERLVEGLLEAAVAPLGCGPSGGLEAAEANLALLVGASVAAAAPTRILLARAFTS
jgi:uncharacterized protein (TIGR02444 family)